MSRVLDAAAPVDRAGRWLPDSTIPLRPVEPIPTDPLTEDERLRELGYLIGSLLQILGDVPPITAELWSAVMAEPHTLAQRFGALDVVDHAGPSLSILIVDHLDSARRVMLWLLTIQDWSLVDELVMDEARVWLDTGTRLLHKIASIATTTPGDSR